MLFHNRILQLLSKSDKKRQDRSCLSFHRLERYGKDNLRKNFAKAINCLDPHDGEPCLECEICKDADNGTLSDIIEIDAASNSKVDDIRELREGVVYTPERCKYKVYIIDEVHMLSAGAFNALLKLWKNLLRMSSLFLPLRRYIKFLQLSCRDASISTFIG